MNTPPEVLRTAVVGIGERSVIAHHAVESGRAHIVAAVDPTPAGRARAQAQFGSEIAAFTDVAGLLDSPVAVDAAFVTSPDDTHASVAIALLDAGIAVFLEKPIAITVESADQILATAARTGTPLYVGHNMRHMAVVRTMRDIITRGEIGTVKAVWCRHFVGNGGDYYFKDWHADRSRSTGLLLQKGAHDIDVIHWLADGYTDLVSGMGALTLYGGITERSENSGRLMSDWFSLQNWPPLSQTGLNPVVDVEDLSMVHLHLDNGVLASYEQCHYTPDYWRNYTVIGTEGRLENFGDGDGGVVRVWDHRTVYRASGDREYPLVEAGDGHGDADVRTVHEFLDLVQYGAATVTSPIASRNAVATGVAATESLRSGSQPIAVAPVATDIAARLADRSRGTNSSTPGPAE